MKLITTSWDDGHVADFRLAELLDKYNLQGTFYIPSTNQEHEVMTEGQIVELSKKFEIGGHTLNHVRIHSTSPQLFQKEIGGCYQWLSDLTGTPPVSFCFPGGVYNQQAIDYTLRIGFKVIRTTELLNPWFQKDHPVYPTTLQVYEHSNFTYVKHLVKRIKIKSLLLYLNTYGTGDLVKLLNFYLNHLQTHGGCFHLWGHSWEIDELHLWHKLEDIFKIMSEVPGAEHVQNKDFLTCKTLSH